MMWNQVGMHPWKQVPCRKPNLPKGSLQNNERSPFHGYHPKRPAHPGNLRPCFSAVNSCQQLERALPPMERPSRGHGGGGPFFEAPHPFWLVCLREAKKTNLPSSFCRGGMGGVPQKGHNVQMGLNIARVIKTTGGPKNNNKCTWIKDKHPPPAQKINHPPPQKKKKKKEREKGEER